MSTKIADTIGAIRMSLLVVSNIIVESGEGDDLAALIELERALRSLQMAHFLLKRKKINQESQPQQTQGNEK